MTARAQIEQARRDGIIAVWRRSLQLAGIVILAEHVFCAERKWRFDFAFPKERVAVEVQGATFGTGPRCRMCGARKAGRHTRGAALVAEYEKLRTACVLGWRVLPVIPQAVTGIGFIEELKLALAFKINGNP